MYSFAFQKNTPEISKKSGSLLLSMQRPCNSLASLYLLGGKNASCFLEVFSSNRSSSFTVIGTSNFTEYDRSFATVISSAASHTSPDFDLCLRDEKQTKEIPVMVDFVFEKSAQTTTWSGSRVKYKFDKSGSVRANEKPPSLTSILQLRRAARVDSSDCPMKMRLLWARFPLCCCAMT
jgi:hypothetical protein